MASTPDPAPAPPPAPNCPFYGRHLIARTPTFGDLTKARLAFFKTWGHQCALKLASASPCDLALLGKPIDWRGCLVWVTVTRDLVGSA